MVIGGWEGTTQILLVFTSPLPARRLVAHAVVPARGGHAAAARDTRCVSAPLSPPLAADRIKYNSC